MIRPENPASEKGGREAISVEKAVKTQIDLIWRLLPEEIRELIKDRKAVFSEALHDSNVTLAEALDDSEVKTFLDFITNHRHMSKYVDATFHSFAIFCDERANDQNFIDRINQGKLTEADFQIMEDKLKSYWTAGHFFGTEEEIKDFCSEYKKHLLDKDGVK